MDILLRYALWLATVAPPLALPSCVYSCYCWYFALCHSTCSSWALLSLRRCCSCPSRCHPSPLSCALFGAVLAPRMYVKSSPMLSARPPVGASLILSLLLSVVLVHAPCLLMKIHAPHVLLLAESAPAPMPFFIALEWSYVSHAAVPDSSGIMCRGAPWRQDAKESRGTKLCRAFREFVVETHFVPALVRAGGGVIFGLF